MGFEGLLGNDRLKENLQAGFAAGRVSHFYLISGPRGSGKHTLAGLLSAALLCRETAEPVPCLHCPACRKVMAGVHPDCVTVDDPEKKTVTVDMARDARADMYVKPNESERKVYLFPRAQDMNMNAQNALLKVLEEPPEYGVFILLADNPEKLLPTVRSRCTELKLSALPETAAMQSLRRQWPDAAESDLQAAFEQSGGFLGQAEELVRSGGNVPQQTELFVEAVTDGNDLSLLEALVPMEKWKRDALAELLHSWQELAGQALAFSSGGNTVSPLARRMSAACSARKLQLMLERLRKAEEYTLANVSPAAVCGWLSWALRG